MCFVFRFGLLGVQVVFNVRLDGENMLDFVVIYLFEDEFFDIDLLREIVGLLKQVIRVFVLVLIIGFGVMEMVSVLFCGKQVLLLVDFSIN